VRVLLIGTLPPPGGPVARRFAKESARRSALGDVVETLSADPLSSSHRTAALRGRGLSRQLRSLSGDFDAVELRIEAGLSLNERSAHTLATALRGYRHVTLFLDSPIPVASGGGGLPAELVAAADLIVVANEADGTSLGGAGAATEKILIVPDCSDAPTAPPPWPAPDQPLLQAAALDVVRRRARADARGLLSGERASILVTATARVRPSLKGSSVWLVRRVIGKTRGAITKVLRPTPRSER
jgi:hypothetical protein